MTRTALQRSSTLIDPSTLPQRPTSKHMDSFNSSQTMPNLNRRNSGPLLNFDANGNELPGPAAPRPGVGMLKSRSVFGVDTLWEREMAKLREIEAEERAQAEAAAVRNGVPLTVSPSSLAPPSEAPAQAEPASPPPVLPSIPKVTVARRPPPPAGVDDLDSDSDAEERVQKPIIHANDGQEATGWNSSDDEAPRRRTVVASPQRGRAPPAAPDSDSEEDLPLVATIGRAAERLARSTVDSDSDEDKPLTALISKVSAEPLNKAADISAQKPNFLSIDFDRPAASKSGDDEDEDEQPLGLRASTMLGAGGSQRSVVVDDDTPLALHPDQQRRTQYAMLAQQQQQMMLMQQQQQAQMQMQMMTGMSMPGSMYFGGPPSAMGSGFFNPAMAGPMMMAPPPSIPSPPPMHDAAKYGRVDRWRHDVAVEGEK
jgi:hypothetical protein